MLKILVEFKHDYQKNYVRTLRLCVNIFGVKMKIKRCEILKY